MTPEAMQAIVTELHKYVANPPAVGRRIRIDHSLLCRMETALRELLVEKYGTRRTPEPRIDPGARCIRCSQRHIEHDREAGLFVCFDGLGTFVGQLENMEDRA